MRHQHSRRGFVQDERRDLDCSMAVTQALFPDNHKREGTLRSSISRAANGAKDGPVFRLRRWVRLAHRLGVPRETVELTVEDLAALVEELYGADAELADAMIRESADDAAEDAAQTPALLDVAHLPDWIAAKKRANASGRTAVAVAERYLRTHSPRVAA